MQGFVARVISGILKQAGFVIQNRTTKLQLFMRTGEVSMPVSYGGPCADSPQRVLKFIMHSGEIF
jgi:hypothetical protein